MKSNINKKSNRKQIQSIFKIIEEEVKQNLLRYNYNLCRIAKNNEYINSKNFWVI